MRQNVLSERQLLLLKAGEKEGGFVVFLPADRSRIYRMHERGLVKRGAGQPMPYVTTELGKQRRELIEKNRAAWNSTEGIGNYDRDAKVDTCIVLYAANGTIDGGTRP